MLDVLAVLRDEDRRQLEKLLAQLRNDLGANEILDGLLLLRLRVDIDLKLSGMSVVSTRGPLLWRQLQGGRLARIGAHVVRLAETYHELVLVRVMCDFWHGDGACDL